MGTEEGEEELYSKSVIISASHIPYTLDILVMIRDNKKGYNCLSS